MKDIVRSAAAIAVILAGYTISQGSSPPPNFSPRKQFADADYCERELAQCRRRCRGDTSCMIACGEGYEECLGMD